MPQLKNRNFFELNAVCFYFRKFFILCIFFTIVCIDVSFEKEWNFMVSSEFLFPLILQNNHVYHITYH